MCLVNDRRKGVAAVAIASNHHLTKISNSEIQALSKILPSKLSNNGQDVHLGSKKPIVNVSIHVASPFGERLNQATSKLQDWSESERLSLPGASNLGPNDSHVEVTESLLSKLSQCTFQSERSYIDKLDHDETPNVDSCMVRTIDDVTSNDVIRNFKLYACETFNLTQTDGTLTPSPNRRTLLNVTPNTPICVRQCFDIVFPEHLLLPKL